MDIGIIISYVLPSVSAWAGHLYHLYSFCKPKGATLAPLSLLIIVLVHLSEISLRPFGRVYFPIFFAKLLQ